jgi:hypothetical protein
MVSLSEASLLIASVLLAPWREAGMFRFSRGKKPAATPLALNTATNRNIQHGFSILKPASVTL